MLGDLDDITLCLPPPATVPLGRILHRARHSVASWLERRRQLRALAQLDDHLLLDIGVSRDDAERACSATFWTGSRRNAGRRARVRARWPRTRTKAMHQAPSALLLSGLLTAFITTHAASQEICKSLLTAKTSKHSDVVNFQRRWTGVFAVDASRCSTTRGAFKVEFVRLKEVGEDLAFTESFAWVPEQTEVSLDLTWDEWVDTYRIAEVSSCPCRQ